MTSREVLGRAVLAAVACAVLAGCGGGDDPVAVPASETTEPWPWEEYPPTPTPTAAPVSPSPTPSVTQTAEPTEVSDQPEPARTAEPEPEEPAEPEPTQEPEEPEPTTEPDEPEPSPDDEIAAMEQDVVDRTNEIREDNDCEPLRADDRLHEAARLHSEDMADRDYFDHESPEGDGPGERAERAGYDDWSGENIAMGYETAEDVVEGWMDSPGHRANILDCDSQAVGVGAAESSRGIYWTQMFGFE